MKKSQPRSRILERLLKAINIAPSQPAHSKTKSRSELCSTTGISPLDQLVWGQWHPRKKQKMFVTARRYRKLIGVVFVFSCFCVFVFGFVFGPWFQVSKIKISPGGVLENEAAVKLALYGASIQKIGFLRTENLLLANPERIEKALYKNFPEIKRVSVRRHFPQTILATVEKRNEAALYCVSEEKQKCYFIDEEGVGWKEAPQITGLVFIKIFEERRPLALGDTFILPHVVQAVFGVAQRVREENKFSIADFKIISPSEIRASTPQGFSIIIDTNEVIDSQLNALFLILQKEIPHDQWGNVEYIDLRILNRVYYKMKN